MKVNKRAVGISDADYVVVKKITVGYKNGKRVRKILWTCPYYRAWSNMISRCYNEGALTLQPSYRGCTVCEEWLLFSNFKKWMELRDWEGKHLDKDLLVRDNKVYSPQTCVFITVRLNSFLTENTACRGEYPVGVYYKKKSKDMLSELSKPYLAQIGDGSGESKCLGLFATPEEAHQAWLKAKLELAKRLAAEQADPRVAKALIDRYENYTED